MRRLGVELGVEAMSLYNHVHNKDDLLDGVVGLLWDEIGAAVALEGSWREDVRAFALGVQQVAHAHPAAFELTFNRGLLPPRALDLAGALAEAFEAAGFDGAVHDAVRTVVGYAAGHMLAEIAWYEDDSHQAAPSPSRAAPADERDSRVRARQTLLGCDCDAQFEFGLEVLLDGLEALRDGAAG